MQRHPVVVVGAGLAGLVAGATVARRNEPVVVVDAHQPGGRARSTQHGRYRFNLGAHALYLGGSAHRILSELGVALPGGAPSVADTHGLVEGRLVRLPTSPRAALDRSYFSAADKAAMVRFLARLQWAKPAAAAGISAATWLDGLELRAPVRAVAEMLLRTATYCARFETLSADAAIGQLQLALRPGVRYLDGGWQALVDALAVRLDCRASITVTSVEPGVVHTTDGPIRASSVIVAVGSPSAAAALLGGDQDWSHRLGPPSVASCLDVGTATIPSPRVVFGLDEPLYLSTHCPPARLAPEGKVVVSCLRYHDGGAVERDRGRADFERLLHLAGIDPEQVEQRRYLHAMVVAGGTPVPEAGGLHGRPAVDATGMPGVFLAADWVGPEGLLADASCASAVAAADRALSLVTA